jgi:hypothetical protein
MNWVIFKVSEQIVMEGEVADHRMALVEKDGVATITGGIRYTCAKCGAEISGDYAHC